MFAEILMWFWSLLLTLSMPVTDSSLELPQILKDIW